MTMILATPSLGGVPDPSSFVDTSIAQAMPNIGIAKGAQDALGKLNAKNLPIPQRANLTETIEFQGRDWPLPPKGALVRVDKPSDYLEFHFNPAEWTQTQSTKWNSVAVPGQNRPLLQWTSGGPHTIAMSLFFLDFWKQEEDRMLTQDAIKWLFKTLYPIDSRVKVSPPKLTLLWGTEQNVTDDGTDVEQATENYIMRSDVKVQRQQFASDMVTIRATVSFVLEEFVESVV